VTDISMEKVLMGTLSLKWRFLVRGHPPGPNNCCKITESKELQSPYTLTNFNVFFISYSAVNRGVFWFNDRAVYWSVSSWYHSQCVGRRDQTLQFSLEKQPSTRWQHLVIASERQLCDWNSCEFWYHIIY